jgi:hypothetical protein
MTAWRFEVDDGAGPTTGPGWHTDMPGDDVVVLGGGDVSGEFASSMLPVSVHGAPPTTQAVVQ